MIEAEDTGYTKKSLEYYKANKEDLGRLLNVEGNSRPEFILEFEGGRKVRFTGLNCGYSGEGPHGLAEILVAEKFFKDFRAAMEYVSGHNKINLNRGIMKRV